MNGWQTKTLGEACEFINRGISPKYLEEGGIAVLNQKCIRDHSVNFDLGRRHDGNAKRVSPDRFVRVGDVLVNSTGTGTLGRVAQLREPPPEAATVDSHVTIVRPTAGLFFQEFFGYALVAIEEQIQAGGEGCGGQTELSRSKLADDYKITFPVDKCEQRRIVEILDEAFEAIGVAKGNAERNLKSASELLETNIGIRFAPHGETVQLSKCATDISDGDHAPPPKSPTGIPFITISNIDKEFRRIDFSDTFSVPREYFDALKPHRRPKRGDVLYTVTGSFGIPVLIENDDEFCFQRHIGLIRPKPEFDSKWLMYALLSPQVRAQAEAGATGTAQRTVSLSVLRGMTIPRIDIERQQQIAEEVDALFEEIGCLKGVMQAKYAALDELKKSLLHHAFTGQLTVKKSDQLVGAVA